MILSLWLVPHEGNPFTKTVQELISDTVPRNFLTSEETHSFAPHVTVISDIDSETALGGKSPQEWLDSLQFPNFNAQSNEVVLELDTVEAEDDFYRKMNIALKNNTNLRELAALCRQKGVLESEEKAHAWSQNEFRPYLGLLYADVPTQDVARKVPLIEMKIGFAIGDIFACCGGTLCMGGELVLVDTSRPVDQWKTIANRETPWAMWKATKNLI